MKADNNECNTFIKLKYGQPSSSEWRARLNWVSTLPREVINKVHKELVDKGVVAPYEPRPGHIPTTPLIAITISLEPGINHINIIYKHLEEYESQDQR